MSAERGVPTETSPLALETKDFIEEVSETHYDIIGNGRKQSYSIDLILSTDCVFSVQKRSGEYQYDRGVQTIYF